MSESEWTLRFKDAVSGPAKAMATATGRLEASMHGLSASMELTGIDKGISRLQRAEGALRRFNATRQRANEQAARMHERAENGALRARDRAARAHERAEGARPGAGGGAAAQAAGGGGALASILAATSASPLGMVAKGYLAIASAALAAATAAAAFTAAFARSVLEAVDFRRGALAALTVMQGSAGKASATYDVGLKLSAKFHADPEDTIRSLQNLVSKDFSTSDATVILTALADLKVVSPTANMEGLTKAIGDIKGKGKLELEELKEQLGENGLPVSKVLDQLAKRMGKSTDEVRKAMSAGKISADEGIYAIVAAVKAMGTGKLGELAENAAHKSLGGLVAGIQSNMQRARLALAKGLDGSEGVSAVLAALNNIVNAVNPDKSPAMKRVISAASTFADTLFRVLFGPLSGQDTGDKLGAVLGAVADGIERITGVLSVVGPLAMEFAGGILDGLGEALSSVGGAVGAVLEALGESGTTLSDMGGVARMVGKAVGVLAVGAALAAGALATLAAGAVALVAGGTAAMASFFAPVLGALPLLVATAAATAQYVSMLPGRIMDAGNGLADALGGLATKGLQALGTAIARAKAWVAAMVGSIANAVTGSSLVSSVLSLGGSLLSAGVELGSNLWRGFVDGITAGIAAVLDAGTRLATAAKSAVASTLTIQSPSRVMAEMGSYTAQGFAQGVEGGQAQVDGAMSNLVAPKPSLRGLGASTTTNSVNAGGITQNITIQGAGDVSTKDIASESNSGLVDALENIAAQLGYGPAPT
jgi:tape measure domain-containing protein